MRIFQILLLLVFLCTSVAYSGSGGNVVFFSSQAGASVKMVGSLDVETPIGYQDIPPGTYHAIFSHGRKKLKHSFRMVAGKTLHLTADFEGGVVHEKYLGERG